MFEAHQGVLLRMERLLSRHLLPRTPSAAARYATAAEQRTKAMQRRWAFGRWGMVMSTMGRISARTGRCFYWCLWNIDKYYMYILSWLYCLRNIGWYDGIYIYDQYEGRIVPLARFDVFFAMNTLGGCGIWVSGTPPSSCHVSDMVQKRNCTYPQGNSTSQ